MMLRPVFTDAQLFSLFIAAADRLEALSGEGLAIELEIMEDAIKELEGDTTEAEEDREFYIQVLVDTQETYNKLREYFKDHPDYGWEEDEFVPSNIDFVAIAAMR